MMYRLILSRTLLVLCGVFASASANAFAVFAVPTNLGLRVGDVVDFSVLVPAAVNQGVPVIWKQTTKAVTLAFTPNPPNPLRNGTTTWNANAVLAIKEWASVGANFRFIGTTGFGNPCSVDRNMVAGFNSSLCLGLPPPALGVTRLVAIIDGQFSVTIVDADIAIVPPGTVVTGSQVDFDAFDGPFFPPNFDFRRLMLHELGHAHGLAHVNNQATVMFPAASVDTLSTDDKNGVLALYPQPQVSSSSGGGGGGSSNGLILALLLAAVILFKFLRSRARHA